MKVLFIPLPLSGHLNPTIKLAKYLLHQNFEVIYGGNHDLLSFTKQQNFEYVSIYSIPLGINMEDLQHQSSKNRWLESLIDRWTDKLFTQVRIRKNSGSTTPYAYFY
jgi:UDP:flavonoid glycosyltransferase YjiC (YdhE family)